MREAVPHLRAAGGGRICLITSCAVKQPIPTLALSNTARTGLWAWAKTAAQDLVARGHHAEPAVPRAARDRPRQASSAATGPMGDPDDFGRVVAFLCSAHAGFVSGAALQVDGAATLASSDRRSDRSRP